MILASCLPSEFKKKFLREWFRMRWRNLLIGFLGIWLIIAAFTINGNLINELVVGIAITILSFWTAFQS